MTHRTGNRKSFLWTLAFALLCGFWMLVASCKPNLPPVEDCRVGIQICRNEQGYQCAGSPTRFFPLGDVPCRRVNAVCELTDAGARCTPVDGGVNADAE